MGKKRNYLFTGLLLAIAVVALLVLTMPSLKRVPLPPQTKPIRLPLPTTTLGSVDQLLKQMEFGHIAFNTPSRINIDDTPQLQLLLSLAEPIERLKTAITAEGEKLGFTVRVSERMEARLRGQAFAITPLTPEIQAVSKIERTEWKWQLKPQQAGRQSLHLTLSALLDIEGHNTPRIVKTFEKTILVEVTTTQKITRFLEANWKWLWTAILIPLVGWGWKVRARRRKGA